MLELQDNNQGQVKKKPYLLLVWALFFSTLFNAAYAILRWFDTGGYVVIDESFLNVFRNTLVVFMAICILGGILLSRWEAPKHKRDQHPLAWVVFEIGVITMTAVDAILNMLKWNALSIVFDFAAISQFIQGTEWLSRLIGGLVNLNILLLVAYFALKIPIATGTATTFVSRVYIHGHRVHESIVGLAWVIIAAALIMYGAVDMERWLGIFYLMFGMFLIGRDYLDVKKLDFLRDFRQKKDAGEINHTPEH